MTTNCPFTRFADALETFIQGSLHCDAPGPGGPIPLEDSQFNRLALNLFALQYQHNAPYQRFCRRWGANPESMEHWTQVPSVPAAAFKELELTSLPPSERIHVFHSSGTAGHRPSRHFHNSSSLGLYEKSLLPWLQIHLLPECGASPHLSSTAGSRSSLPAFLCLTPPPALAPHSSLAHMFDAVCRRFGGDCPRFVGVTRADGSWQLDPSMTLDALSSASPSRQPLLLLGTAFSFVQLLEALAERHLHFALPAGSRVLETGGYKGRTRALPKAELHALITERLGILPANIISEYGMSELSSQAYDGVAGEADQSPIPNRQSSMRKRRFRFPPWARARVVSPETGEEVAEGGTGLIRVCDLANAWSVMSIQTEDLGARRGDGFELMGRASLAEPRGCSLMAVS